MEIIERITETLEKRDKKATDLCDRLGIRTSTMSTWKTRNSDRQQSTSNLLLTSWAYPFIICSPAKRLLPASSLLQKRMNFLNCTGRCRRTKNLNLSGNSKAS